MRPDGWEQALDSVLAKHARAPFDWKDFSCFSMAMEAAQACGADNPFARFMGFKTEAGAARALRKAGHDSLTSLMASAFEAISIADVQRGDIAIVVRDGIESCAVVSAAGLAVKGERGVRFEPLTEASSFFKVN